VSIDSTPLHLQVRRHLIRLSAIGLALRRLYARYTLYPCSRLEGEGEGKGEKGRGEAPKIFWPTTARGYDRAMTLLCSVAWTADKTRIIRLATEA